MPDYKFEDVNQGIHVFNRNDFIVEAMCNGIYTIIPRHPPKDYPCMTGSDVPLNVGLLFDNDEFVFRNEEGSLVAMYHEKIKEVIDSATRVPSVDEGDTDFL